MAALSVTNPDPPRLTTNIPMSADTALCTHCHNPTLHDSTQSLDCTKHGPSDERHTRLRSHDKSTACTRQASTLTKRFRYVTTIDLHSKALHSMFVLPTLSNSAQYNQIELVKPPHSSLPEACALQPNTNSHQQC